MNMIDPSVPAPSPTIAVLSEDGCVRIFDLSPSLRRCSRHLKVAPSFVAVARSRRLGFRHIFLCNRIFRLQGSNCGGLASSQSRAINFLLVA